MINYSISYCYPALNVYTQDIPFYFHQNMHPVIITQPSKWLKFSNLCLENDYFAQNL